MQMQPEGLGVCLCVVPLLQIDTPALIQRRTKETACPANEHSC